MRELIIGVYTKSPKGDFGFIDPESGKGYYIHLKNVGKAISGDTVEAYIKEFRGKKEAVITKILKKGNPTITGKLDIKKDFAFVTPTNPIYVNDIYIGIDKVKKFEKENNIKLKYNDIVSVKITKWTTKNPEGFIFDYIGKETDKDLELKTIISGSGIKTKFDESTIQEANKLKFELPPKRIDLTNKLTYTIDGEDARDLDDAIIVEKIDDKYKLYVCIADVAEYVKHQTSLDKEAFKRGNSTYLVDRVIPMLPEKLSNDLCSLNPQTKKLSLTCEILLDKYGNVSFTKVYESVILSDFRLTYKEVQSIIDGEIGENYSLKFGQQTTKELIENIFLANELKNIVKKNKQKLGVLDFDFPEVKILTDDQNNVVDIKKYELYESNKIIEEFMILANSCVGEFFKDIPFVYRIHPEPSVEDIEKLRNTLHIFDIKLPFKKNITPKTISDILVSLKDNKNKNLISSHILRALAKAIYSDENKGHFGLALSYYSHFTSPIRRYRDLIIHRIIKQKIHGKLDKKSINIYKNSLKEITKHISDTEKKSEKLEYEVRDYMICKFYENKIGTHYNAKISSLIEAGIFIELENHVEGFINITSLSNGQKYVFDSTKMQFTVGKDLYKLGDNLKVILKEIDFSRKRLIFEKN